VIRTDKLFFLPFFTKWIGLLLMALGLVGLYYFVYHGNKPDWLQWNVFTFYSKYIHSRFFTFIPNNQGDEISTLIYFFGAFLVFFSAEKKAESFHIPNKIKSLSYSALIIIVLYVLFVIFFHGIAVVIVSLSLFYFFPVVCLVLFPILNKRSQK